MRLGLQGNSSGFPSPLVGPDYDYENTNYRRRKQLIDSVVQNLNTECFKKFKEINAFYMKIYIYKLKNVQIHIGKLTRLFITPLVRTINNYFVDYILEIRRSRTTSALIIRYGVIYFRKFFFLPK